MILRYVSGALIALGLIPFFLGAWVLLGGGEFNAEAVAAYLLCAIAFFVLAAALSVIMRPNRSP